MQTTDSPSPSPRAALLPWLSLVVGLAIAVVGFVALRTISARIAAKDPKLEWVSKEDIYYSWLEGARILRREDPYARILGGDMRTNDKYATYLPGFYLICSAVEAAGWDEFPEFIALARSLAPPFQVLTALVFFWAFAARGHLLLGAAVALFYLFNRFTLYVLGVTHLENFVLLPFALALALLPRWPRAAYLAFGVSLALKQIAIFLVPLFLLHAWRSTDAQARWTLRLRDAALRSLWMVLPPLLVSIPFLLWGAKGYVLSILFSATRSAGSHMGLPSVESMLALEGLAARLPMLGLIALCYGAYLRGGVGVLGVSALIMVLFIGFNPVLFNQYFVWALVPALLALLEVLSPPAATPSPKA